MCLFAGESQVVAAGGASGERATDVASMSHRQHGAWVTAASAVRPPVCQPVCERDVSVIFTHPFDDCTLEVDFFLH